MKKLLLALLCMALLIPAAVMAEPEIETPAQFALTNGTATFYTVENGQYVAAKEYATGTWAQVLKTNRALDEVVMQDGTAGFMDGDDLTMEADLGELHMLLEDEDGVVNMRLDASMSSRVRRYQKAGKAVMVLEKGETFSLCNYKGLAEGYIINARLGDALTAEIASQSGARMRKGPGMAHEQIRMVPCGAEVTVLIQGARWCKVAYKDYVGFVSADSLAY